MDAEIRSKFNIKKKKKNVKRIPFPRCFIQFSIATGRIISVSLIHTNSDKRKLERYERILKHEKTESQSVIIPSSCMPGKRIKRKK